MKKKSKIMDTVTAPSDDWQKDDDLRTLQRAEEIKSNTKRMRGVKHYAKKNMSTLAKIAKGPIDKFMKYRGISK